MSITKSSPVVFASLFFCLAPLFAQDAGRPDNARGGGRRAGGPAPEAKAEGALSLPPGWEEAMQWRSIGPANMGGRITDFAVHPRDKSTWWVATATSGVLKTTNDGDTFEYLFTQEGCSSIGAIAVAESDPEVVWVGTGERNPRNSVSFGDGVYKSVDGGAHWKNMGLKESFQIGSVVIDPSDANIVYVGALGRLWGESDERGLYKTVDGGETWKRVLEIDAHTGVVDIVMSPEDPKLLLVASYERERDAFCTNDPAKKWGEGSGLWRTTDGGEHFEPIHAGLPDGRLGRIGLNWYPKNPQEVFMLVECERISQEPENAAFAGISGEDAEVGARLTEIAEKGPAAETGLKVGDIVISVDGVLIHSYQDLLDNIRQHLAGDTVGLIVSRQHEGQEFQLTFSLRPGEKEDEAQEGGRNRNSGDEEANGWKSPYPDPGPFRGTLGGQAANAQLQQGPAGYLFGGLYKSLDAGLTWTRINSLNPRPMYYSEVRVDPSDDQRLYVLGTSLHRSKDGGETFTPDGHDNEVHVDHHALWIDPDDGRHMLLGNDGGIYVTHDRMEHWDHHNHVAIGQFYQVSADGERDYRVFGGLQDNGSWGGPSSTRTRTGPINSDWMNVGGGDGFVCRVDADDPDQIYYESQNGGMGSRNLRTGERGFLQPRAPKGVSYRFNWMTPFLLSSHNSQILYAGGNYVFRSLKKGTNMQRISPEITRTVRGSATALAESARDEAELWVGTDDGALWSTHDGGQSWKDLFEGRVIVEPSPKPEPEASSIAAATPAEAAKPASESAPATPAAQVVEAELRTQASEPATLVAAVARAQARQAQALEAGAPRADASQSQTHPLAGTWIGEATGAEIEPGEGEFELDFELSSAGELRGELRASVGQGALKAVSFDEKTAQLGCSYDADGMTLVFEGTLDDGQLSGTIDFAGGAMVLDFTARRESSTPQAKEPVAAAAPKAQDEGRAKGEAGARRRRESAAEATPESAAQDAAAADVEVAKTQEPEGTEKPSAEAKAAEPGAAAESGEPAAGDKDAKKKPAGPSLAELVLDPHRVSAIVCSRHQDERVYVSFDGHRTDYDLPLLFASEDGGESWSSIRGDLPDKAGPVRTLEEDIQNPNLLYAGCEFGLYVTLDRGKSWTRLHSNLPTVPVHSIAQPVAAPEIVAGTHGRSLWILDVSALRQMTAETLAEKAHLFQPAEAVRWRSDVTRGDSGTRRFVGQNAPSGARIDYLVGKGVRSVDLRITGKGGELVREFEALSEPGLHSLAWDLRKAPPAGSNSRWRRGQSVEPGTYQVELTVDGTTQRADLQVRIDPDYPEASWMQYEDFEEHTDEEEELELPTRRIH